VTMALLALFVYKRLGYREVTCINFTTSQSHTLRMVFLRWTLDSVLSSSVLRGRPFGGCATLIKNSLLPVTKCLKCDDLFVILMISDTIFINVFFPCKGPDSLSVLQDMICQIDNVLSFFCNVKIVLSGDINNNMYERNKYTN